LGVPVLVTKVEKGSKGRGRRARGETRKTEDTYPRTVLLKHTAPCTCRVERFVVLISTHITEDRKTIHPAVVSGIIKMVNKVPVVQGVAVASPYEHNHATSNPNQTDRRFEKGEKQPTRCRDPLFALLFYAQLAAMIACAVIYGPAAREQYAFQGLNISGDATGYLKLAAVLGVISLVLSGLMLSILMCIPQFIIKVALFFNLGIWIAYAVLGFMSGNFFLGIIGALFALMSMCKYHKNPALSPGADSNSSRVSCFQGCSYSNSAHSCI